MSSVYLRASATSDGLGDLKSALFQLMTSGSNEGVGGRSGKDIVSKRLQMAFGLIARFVVRRDLSSTDIEETAQYLLTLFPCGALAAVGVECFDGSKRPVTCGQLRIFHCELHRSSVLVKTVDADWMKSLSEWFNGGVTHAWPGPFICHSSFEAFDRADVVGSAIQKEIEGYRLEKCLEGLSREVGTPWLMRAHESLRGSSLKIRRDLSKMCLICTAKGVDPGFIARMWVPPDGNHLPACQHCHGILEKHGLSTLDARATTEYAGEEGAWNERCAVCSQRRGWRSSGLEGGARSASHRICPCKCPVCESCAEFAASTHRFACPLCGQPFTWMTDERALLQTGWHTAVQRTAGVATQRSCVVACALRN